MLAPPPPGELALPPRENPGSATAYVSNNMLICTVHASKFSISIANRKCLKLRHSALLLGFGQLLKRTKRSIRIRCWSPMSTEWMPEDKAKTFPLQDYPVQFELISCKSSTSSQNRISFQRIEDIFDLQETKQPSKVLLKGMHVLVFIRAAVNQ